LVLGSQSGEKKLSDNPSEKEAAYLARYQAAAHGMQSGVALEENYNGAPTSGKHLRIGVNASLSDQAGLVALLIEKGVFTREEYMLAITLSMEEERARYERHLLETYKLKVTLA